MFVSLLSSTFPLAFSSLSLSLSPGHCDRWFFIAIILLLVVVTVFLVMKFTPFRLWISLCFNLLTLCHRPPQRQPFPPPGKNAF